MGLGGPKTEAGKAVSSRNALRHGLLSESPLAAPFESAAEWLAHRQAILDDLRPSGQAEACLAERAALLLWRLRRVACAEVAAIEARHASVAEDYRRRLRSAGEPAPHVDDLRWQAQSVPAEAELHASPPARPDAAPPDPPC